MLPFQQSLLHLRLHPTTLGNQIARSTHLGPNAIGSAEHETECIKEILSERPVSTGYSPQVTGPEEPWSICPPGPSPSSAIERAALL